MEREFMLLEDDYVVRPDTVFLDAGMKVRVAYYPGYRVNLRRQLCSLCEYMMDHVEYKDEGAVMLVYSFYSQTKNENTSLEDLFGVISACNVPESNNDDGRKGLPIYDEQHVLEQTAFREIIPDNSYVAPGIMEAVKQSPLRLRMRTVIIPLTMILIVLLLLKSGVFINPLTGKTYVLAIFGCIFCSVCIVVGLERKLWKRFYDQLECSLKSASAARDEATVMVFSDGTAAYPFSLVSDEFEPIHASRFPFVIGKSRETSDYCLDKVGVSRQHLRIDRETDGFSLADLGSTNGTFVNSVRLRPGVATPVRRGDEIRIGSYIYYCN